METTTDNLVAYVTDENYMDILRISVKSMLDTNPDIPFAIVSDQPVNIPGMSENRVIGQSPLTTMHPYVTGISYRRFEIPKLFPQYRRILYLDCDTIVQNDLSPIFNQDLTGRPLGMTQTYDGARERQSMECGHDRYFLSGLILFDTCKCNETGLSDRYFSLLDDPSNRRNDEWLVNKYLYGDICELPLQCHMCHDRPYGRNLNIENAIVRHIVGKDKSQMFNWEENRRHIKHDSVTKFHLAPESST